MRSWWLTLLCWIAEKQVQLEHGISQTTCRPCASYWWLLLLLHPGEATETAAARATEALFRLQTVLRQDIGRCLPRGLGPAELSRCWTKAGWAEASWADPAAEAPPAMTVGSPGRQFPGRQPSEPVNPEQSAGRAAAPLAQPAMDQAAAQRLSMLEASITLYPRRHRPLAEIGAVLPAGERYHGGTTVLPNR